MRSLLAVSCLDCVGQEGFVQGLLAGRPPYLRLRRHRKEERDRPELDRGHRRWQRPPARRRRKRCKDGPAQGGYSQHVSSPAGYLSSSSCLPELLAHRARPPFAFPAAPSTPSTDSARVPSQPSRRYACPCSSLSSVSGNDKSAAADSLPALADCQRDLMRSDQHRHRRWSRGPSFPLFSRSVFY
jgi:hypothetical protein